MTRLGIVGGTFDPIHYGHLFIGEEARQRFALDKVLFVPNGQPPHKTGVPVTPALHRLEMVRLATENHPQFSCSAMEIERGGLSYTVETLYQLKRELPEVQLFYITGIDAVADILTWKRHEEVIELAQFIAATRPGFESGLLETRLPADYRKRIHLVETTGLGISSTDLRRRFRAGEATRFLLPEAVRDYIETTGLYRG
ncbi:MAG: nicotinate-nucleotide adenylyltransferase [Chthonomonadaceae bacterium]|nr:nicotinate-nucleotide adenylyltransferase [Chthonomonadaceae bacterium]